MRIKAAILALLLSFGATAYAGPGGCTNSPSLFPFAFETITVSSTALGFTATTAFPAGQQPGAMAVCRIEVDGIRYRADGLNPTATVGMLESVGGTFTACGEASMRRFRMIRVTADSTVSCSYYREGDQ